MGAHRLRQAALLFRKKHTPPQSGQRASGFYRNRGSDLRNPNSKQAIKDIKGHEGYSYDEFCTAAAIAAVIAQAIDAINAERLVDDTGTEADAGYTAGLDDAIKAVAAYSGRGVMDATRCGQCRYCLTQRWDGQGLPPTATRMVTCRKCGNKRCPMANDCGNLCTGSNEPGQKGSAYE